MQDFFTSDSHLWHANIIKYSQRPQFDPNDFMTVTDDKGRPQEVWKNNFIKKSKAREMTEFIIAKHNAKVSPEDTVWHLGDYSMGRSDRIIVDLRRMNGNFKFIWGNHDDNLKAFKSVISYYSDLEKRVEFLGDYAEVIIQGQPMTLTHYAMRVWNGSHKGTWNLYGHSHGSLSDDPHSRSFDVGVDCHNYEPISFHEVKAIMAKKLWKPIDHHGAKQEGGGIGLSRDDYAKAVRKAQYEALKKEFEA